MTRGWRTALVLAALGALFAALTGWAIGREGRADRLREQQRAVDFVASEIGTGPMERPRPFDPARFEALVGELRRLWPGVEARLVETDRPPQPPAALVSLDDAPTTWLVARFPGEPDPTVPWLPIGAAVAFAAIAGAARLLLPPDPDPSKTSKDEEDDELDRLRAENARLRRHGEEWIAHAAHDLRTPLAILHGSLETLALPEESLGADERRRYLDSALAQAERLGRLVADLFDLTRFDRQTRPRTERFHLGELVQDHVQLYQARAAERGLTLRADFDAGLPPVRAEVGMIERALRNLVDNALRHTASGGTVTVRLRRREERLRLEIEDTGCGIPAHELPHIFDRFYRSRGLSTTGAGLGLAIAQRIAEIHGSRLRVESEVGVGSRFFFDLPFLRSSEES